MIELKSSDVSWVAGGDNCFCSSIRAHSLRDPGVQNKLPRDLGSKMCATKSECHTFCCEVRGAYGYTYTGVPPNWGGSDWNC